MDENPYKSPRASCRPPDVEPPRRFLDDLTPRDLAWMAIFFGAGWYSMEAFSVVVWAGFGSIAVTKAYRFFKNEHRLRNS